MDAAQKITHAIDRLSFGARPGDRTQVEKNGVAKYIQTQLAAAGSTEPAELRKRLKELPTLSLSPVKLFEPMLLPKNPSEAERKKSQEWKRRVFQQALQAKWLRALDSSHQLQEVMTDFWFNHFNVDAEKHLTMVWVGNYEQTIRTHALGKFRDLLSATAKHPAMLFYLDNWRNTDPNSEQAKGPFRGLNENYARELMELHTLGIDGGYTQADVETLARTLTGWSIVHQTQPSPDGSGFVFAANRHDPRPKTLLGQSITAGGIEDGEQALDLLATHPATARHISYKLAQFFVADTPPERLVSKLSERFLSTKGNIKAVLQSLFDSSEFWETAHYQRKFRTPYQYLLAMSRAVGMSAPTEETLKRLNGSLWHMGMPLYKCRSPKGYAQVESAWISPDVMMRRVSLAIATTRMQKAEQQAERQPDLPVPSVLLETLGDQIPPESRAIINQAPENLRAALILGSPNMMYR